MPHDQLALSGQLVEQGSVERMELTLLGEVDELTNAEVEECRQLIASVSGVPSAGVLARDEA